MKNLSKNSGICPPDISAVNSIKMQIIITKKNGKIYLKHFILQLINLKSISFSVFQSWQSGQDICRESTTYINGCNTAFSHRTTTRVVTNWMNEWMNEKFIHAFISKNRPKSAETEQNDKIESNSLPCSPCSHTDI